MITIIHVIYIYTTYIVALTYIYVVTIRITIEPPHNPCLYRAQFVLLAVASGLLRG